MLGFCIFLSNNTMTANISTTELFLSKSDARQFIKDSALSLGFADCGFISPTHPIFKAQLTALQNWLDKGFEASLQFLHDNHELRANPDKLVIGTKTIISVRMDYLVAKPTHKRIDDNARPNSAIIARYARGRDYHKTMRGQLKKLAQIIQDNLPRFRQFHDSQTLIFRPFSDSAPIFERPLAEHAGLGFTGKHTLLINQKSGSFFVLGELFVSLDIAEEIPPPRRLCGSCTACIDICPTKAIIAPHTIDAGACISYLTIEHKGSIPIQYRQGLGNKIFGCDDCQLICPWNKFAKITSVADFEPRHSLDDIDLLDIWGWDEQTFLTNTEGSAIRRTGYVGLLRNVAVALGNALAIKDNRDIRHKLTNRLGENDLLDEHIHWALTPIK